MTVTAGDGGLSSSISFIWNTVEAPVITNGLKADYFNGTEPGVGAPLVTRIDPKIDFDWASGSPGAGIPADNFSARWTGTLTAPYSEVYSFWVPSDNGVRIWINNQLVLNKWTPADISGWHNFDLALTANQAVPIKVEYSEFSGGANITLYWYSATQAWEAISSSRFKPSTSTNQAPVLTSPGTQSNMRGRTALLALQGSDPDSNALSWSATGLPSGLTINASSGVISGTVANTAAATNNTTVVVSDGSLTASANFTWLTTAPPANVAPVVYNPGTQSSLRGSIVSLSPLAADPEGDALTWSATGLPAGLSINATSGQISGTVLTTAATSSGVTLTVRDPAGLTGSVSFTWNTTAAPLNGLRAEYFNGIVPGAGTPLLVRTDATIDFDWGGGSPDPVVPVDNFSARWTGTLTAPFSEVYSIYVPSDNGVRIWLNNQLVLDKWTPDDISGWHNFNIALTAGQAIPFKVEYAELSGGANIALYWFSNRQAWEAINPRRLSPTLVLPPNSAETATKLINDTQSLQTFGNGTNRFTFRRPSSSAGLLALIVEQSSDLQNWTITETPAQVIQRPDGSDEISIPIPAPGALQSAPNCFYRVHFVVPE